MNSKLLEFKTKICLNINYIYIGSFSTSIHSRDTNIPNKWPLCWNYISGFDFGRTVIISMWFSIGLQILSKLHNRWWGCDITSVFKMAANGVANLLPVSVLVTYRITSKSIRIPNFAKTALSAAEILLFPVSENKRPPYWNSTYGSIFTFPSSSAVILGRRTKFYPNRTVDGRVMTS